MLVWAIIRGHTGLKCVNPFLLPCGFIQPETEVEMEETNDAMYDYDMQVENTKPYSKLQSSVFFVSISDRKRERAITKVHYTDVRHNDVCVFASPCQNYKEAMIRDSRFIDVDNFTLRRKVVGGQGATIAMNEKPADLGEIVLEVIVNRAVHSTDNKCSMPLNKSNYPMASTAESTSDVVTTKRSVSETPGKKQTKRYFNELTNKLWEESAVYLFSKAVDGLTNQELLSEREECLRARAWCTLLGPEDRARGMAKFEKSLEKLAKVEFANNKVISRPVRFTKTLCELYNSIGYLKCGGVRATCFLVSSDMIATNWHVVRDIEIARNSSTPYDHSEVYIDFDFETIANGRSLSNEHKLKPLSYERNVICSKLDYAFLFLEECVEGKLPLGDFVRCKVPEQGMVCIVGHPGDQEKQDELCPILPLHDDRRSLELERRYEENELQCRNNQSRCALAYVGQKCVHSYQSELQQLCGKENAVTYDVGSMFEGSSGAPVFDMKCNIVALHSGGFRIGETSIVEYAVTFDAIIEDLWTAEHSEFVREHFPYYCHQDMETK